MRSNIIRAWRGLDDGHRAFAAQVLRYGIVGLGVTSFQIAIYNLLIGAGHRPPLVANILATAAAMVVGYTIHSRFTFDGHGSRDNVARTGVRFVAVSMAGLALNSVWVWLFAYGLHLSPHLASLPMYFATPLVLFWLNRRWVFE